MHGHSIPWVLEAAAYPTVLLATAYACWWAIEEVDEDLGGGGRGA